MDLSPGDLDRFWFYVNQSGDCWLWEGATDGLYGRFWCQGGMRPAHRVAWELAHGPIPARRYVRHRCPHLLCVRPAHLMLGSAGVAGWLPVKLSPGQVTAIRERYAAGGVTQRQLAAEFGVHVQTISLLLRGKTWRAVAPVPPVGLQFRRGARPGGSARRAGQAGQEQGRPLRTYTCVVCGTAFQSAQRALLCSPRCRRERGIQQDQAYRARHPVELSARQRERRRERQGRAAQPSTATDAAR